MARNRQLAFQRIGTMLPLRDWPHMSRDLMKTITYLVIHLGVGFGVAYAFTGSVTIASGIALVEPMVNAVAFFFHEKVWRKIPTRGATPAAA